MQKTHHIKNLIIGANSKIVSEIKSHLSNFIYVSHKDLNKIDFEDYKYIFLFSWDNKLADNYINLVRSLPLHKTIFISTIAVFSLHIRQQWASYPNNKKLIEDIICYGGGSIIRIGIWGSYDKSKYFSYLPVTSKESLINTLVHWQADSTIVNLFEIIDCTKLTPTKFIFKTLYKFSTFLPTSKLFQAPLAIIPKYFKFKSYGYTADACSSFHDSILIGYGCLGSTYVKKKNFSGLIIASDLPDYNLNNNGFRSTKIGRSRTGLAKYWHGVQIVISHTGNPVKKVPFFPLRPRLPKSAKLAHVNKISVSEGCFEVFCTTQLQNYFYFSNKLILGAGPIENILLLLNLTGINEEIYCSDHEIGMIGTMLLKDCVSRKILSKFGFIIFSRKILRNSQTFKYCLDFRPYVPDKHNSTSDFYMDSTRGILLKLIKYTSFSRLNEAFFNKFGFAFATNKISVFIQILNMNSISISRTSIKRKRFTINDWSEIIKSVKNLLPEFISDNHIHTIDGQHIVGGATLLKNLKISNLIKSDKLLILGSPTHYELDDLHHTIKLQNSI